MIVGSLDQAAALEGQEIICGTCREAVHPDHLTDGGHDKPLTACCGTYAYIVDRDIGTPKSRRASRSVPLADEAAQALEHLYGDSAFQGDDDLVFADPRSGEPIDKSIVSRRLRAALRAAKLDDAHTFHDLRHTFGTRMAAAGVPMRTLMEWMGHRDLHTTLPTSRQAPGTRSSWRLRSREVAIEVAI